MYLKQVTINGFKSFADKTVIELPKGIVGIVGPNGCGKSNIVDAIRWVLGEQSAKALRGGKMQDVIFQGTDKRKPLQMCEVKLLFGECEQDLKTNFSEVEITRRVSRDGGSDYFINGKISPTLDTVSRIASHLDIDAIELFKEKDEVELYAKYHGKLYPITNEDLISIISKKE